MTKKQDHVATLGHIGVESLLGKAESLWRRDHPDSKLDFSTGVYRFHYLAMAASVHAQETVLMDREHSGAWPCDGEGDESGNFVCRKSLELNRLRTALRKIASCEKGAEEDVVDIAIKALAPESSEH